MLSAFFRLTTLLFRTIIMNFQEKLPLIVNTLLRIIKSLCQFHKLFLSYQAHKLENNHQLGVPACVIAIKEHTFYHKIQDVAPTLMTQVHTIYLYKKL